MKPNRRFKFIWLVTALFVVTFVIATVLFGLVQWYLPEEENVPVVNPDEATGAAADSAGAESAAAPVPTTDPVSTSEGIPLNTLPLSESQQELAKTVGVDVDTFVITPDMINCAEAKLGAARFAEIVGGDSPTMLETLSLMACL